MATELEEKYTSTGSKYLHHLEQLQSYKSGGGNTVISTHISPEGSCNLSCSYCSVSNRKKGDRIELSVAKDYVLKSMSRGLKAVILTGGGEPTLYPQFNELVNWLHENGLEVALITNGTNTDAVEDWSKFSWVRISINKFDGWEEKINLPAHKISPLTTVGCSYIDTGNLKDDIHHLIEMIDKLNAKYLRILPNCLLNHYDFLEAHISIADILADIDDKRVFHQHKFPQVSRHTKCYQSYFRPYLSEIDGGTVFPCDSVVLNDKAGCFTDKFKICKADKILDYLDNKIKTNFNPVHDCSACVFTDSNDLIKELIEDGSIEDRAIGEHLSFV